MATLKIESSEDLGFKLWEEFEISIDTPCGLRVGEVIVECKSILVGQSNGSQSFIYELEGL